jgi:hypothetical protein
MSVSHREGAPSVGSGTKRDKCRRAEVQEAARQRGKAGDVAKASTEFPGKKDAERCFVGSGHEGLLSDQIRVAESLQSTYSP